MMDLSALGRVRLAKRALEAILDLIEASDTRRPDVLRYVDSVRGRARALESAVAGMRLRAPEHCEHLFTFEVTNVNKECASLMGSLLLYVRTLEGHRMAEPDNDAGSSIMLTIDVLTKAEQAVGQQVALLCTLAASAAHEKARAMRESERERHWS